jgi:serine/threonine protein kinase
MGQRQLFRNGGLTGSPTPLVWKKGEQIGRGTYGHVHMALNQTTGELFCVKSIRISLGEDATARITALEKEIQVMKSLEHPHIVRYLGTEKAQEDYTQLSGATPQVYIFLEYVPGGSLSKMLKQFGAFGTEIIRRYTKQILKGLNYLHQQGIIHRDIKGANVLVTETGIAKLADFGCSKQLQGAATGSMDESLRSIRGSVPWMAPEVIKQSGSGRSADVWSLGCTVIEMATGKRPWPHLADNFSALFQVATAKTGPPYPDDPVDELATFLDACFLLAPEKRATCEDLLTFELVASVEVNVNGMSPKMQMVTKSAEF